MQTNKSLIATKPPGDIFSNARRIEKIWPWGFALEKMRSSKPEVWQIEPGESCDTKYNKVLIGFGGFAVTLLNCSCRVALILPVLTIMDSIPNPPNRSPSVAKKKSETTNLSHQNSGFENRGKKMSSAAPTLEMIAQVTKKPPLFSR
jgi:hypothetical protein